MVRETVGLVAYRAEEWSEAISELRAARRMGDGSGQLAVLADCERALGHPERAIELGRSPEAEALDPDAALELRIVVAGARADLDQLDAAIVHLRGAGLPPSPDGTTPARLAFAYADLLERAGRTSDALEWFMAAAEADDDDETDAAQRATAVADSLATPAPSVEPAADVAGPAADAPEPAADAADPDVGPADPPADSVEPGGDPAEPDVGPADPPADSPEPDGDPAGRAADTAEPDPTVLRTDADPAPPDPWGPGFSDHPDEPVVEAPEAGAAAGSLFSHPDEPVR